MRIARSSILSSPEIMLTCTIAERGQVKTPCAQPGSYAKEEGKAEIKSQKYNKDLASLVNLQQRFSVLRDFSYG
jgi:hypothetical protein